MWYWYEILIIGLLTHSVIEFIKAFFPGREKE
jgi:VanZ family protein